MAVRPLGWGPELHEAIVAITLIATANGAPDGSTIECDTLAALADLSGQSVRIRSGTSLLQSKAIDSHVGNTLTFVDHFANQILLDTYFIIYSGGGGGGGGSDITRITVFGTEIAAATNANGVNWVTLFDGSAITIDTLLIGIRMTVVGAWAGTPRWRIVDQDGTKIFPFQDENDIHSGIEEMLEHRVEIPGSKGYIVQFRSTAAGDVGAAFTVALNNLNKIELG